MNSNLLMNFSIDKENKKILVEREFAAPVAIVWSAWTESELLDQWWAPKPWKAETKSMDFSEGGFWLYAMVGPEGEKHWARADFLKIVKFKFYSGKDAFCDEEGNINHEFPIAYWKVEFQPKNEATKVKVEISYDEISDLEKYIEMGFKEGFSAALENLDDLLDRKSSSAK